MKKIFIFAIIFGIASVTSFMTVELPNTVSIGTFSLFQAKFIEDTVVQLPSSISFVGDVMLGRRVETYLKEYGNEYVYSNLPSLSTTTVLVGNFESSIPKQHAQTPELTFSFSVDTQYIPSLAEYGFEFMSLANNHTLDKGKGNFRNTQNILSDNSITAFGDPQIVSTTTVSYITLNNAVVALVGIHTLTSQPSITKIESLMSEVSKNSDLQIAYLHWGVEYEPIHSKKQQNFARVLIDLGFDSVTGNHPHVVQDIELYKGVPIFYSLGNFIFDQYFSKEVQEGLWLELSVVDNAFYYNLKGITSIGSRSAPRFMSAVENDILLTDIAKKSSVELKKMIRGGYIDTAQIDQ